MKALFLFLIIIGVVCSCDQKKSNASVAENPITDTLSLRLSLVTGNLVSPIAFTHCEDDRLFIVEQPGVVRVFDKGKLLTDPFLDISDRVLTDKGYSEKGLLGIAFHPEYKTNGKFYLYYSAKSNNKNSDHKSVVSEFMASPDSNVARKEERKILEIEEPESNHNGGQLAFGPDGFLYIGVGDGGGAGDKHGETGNGQNMNTLLGKILRIDVNTFPYAIPSDNPFVNKPGIRPEIFASGLRNPWRFSFDRKSSRLFCGDVGQNEYEEIDIIERGKNYGWRAMEGNHVFDNEFTNNNFEPPIHEYGRAEGACVIGGYVYRGEKIAGLQGKYIFADWSGKIYLLEESNGWTRVLVNFTKDKAITINSLGEDSRGEVYVLGQQEVGGKNASGLLYKIVSR
ncbi:MAG: PQQ-dependent sugar dehydrogenase [Cytophagaceae bacterium]|nr:PQQ-dependent sugar dehydrogenase [Cytophagaceae bacterium]